MNILIIIIQILIIFLLPYLLIKLREKKVIKTFGTIGAAYFIGIMISLLLFLFRKAGVSITLDADVSQVCSYLAIGVAIPMLLFSTNLKTVKKLSKKVMISFGLMMASVVAVSIIVGFSMKGVLPSSNILSGMAVGLYTGGTPNLNAIGSIFGLSGQTIALANLSDMIIGGIFYVFLLIACKPLLSKILKEEKIGYYTCDTEGVRNIDTISTEGVKAKPLFVSILSALGVAVLGAGIGILLWYILGAKDGKMFDYLVPSVMITATILGLICSCSKRLRETKGNNLVGHYLILVFSVALAMSLNFEDIGKGTLYIFLMYASVTIGTFILHTLLCKIFKVDVDCAMVTLTAGLYGPAFIPAITKQIKNEDLTAAGLICGSFGYAIGTFIGLAVGLFMGIF